MLSSSIMCLSLFFTYKMSILPKTQEVEPETGYKGGVHVNDFQSCQLPSRTSAQENLRNSSLGLHQKAYQSRAGQARWSSQYLVTCPRSYMWSTGFHVFSGRFWSCFDPHFFFLYPHFSVLMRLLSIISQKGSLPLVSKEILNLIFWTVLKLLRLLGLLEVG